MDPMTTTSHGEAEFAATRRAPDGTEERVEFRGRDGERIYSYLYLPASRPRGVVVICPPLYGEFVKNYRREVLLARRLASNGFAVERFHYRGMGNSDGDGSGLTFETMREDALACVEHVQHETGVETLFLVGTRLGGLVAASAASATGASIVVWAPLLDAAGFFRDGFRSRLVQDRKEGVAHPLGRAQLEADLQAGRDVDLLANTVQPQLFQTMADRSLVEELGSGSRDALLVQIGPTSSASPDLARVVERLRTAGVRVDVQTVKGDEVWWIVDDRWTNEGRRPITVNLLELTARWMQSRVSAGGSA